MTQEWYTAVELAGLPGMPATKFGIIKKAKRGDWKSQKRQGKGGGKEYHISNLPPSTQAKLLIGENKAVDTDLIPKNESLKYDREALWEWAERQTEKRRDVGQHRADLLRQCMILMGTGCTFKVASNIVAESYDVNASNLRNWYYGVNNKLGAKHYDSMDWPAALIAGYKPRPCTAECDPAAWDWIKGHFLNRRQPSFASSYRRLCDIAAVENWTIPSERTLQRRMDAEVSIYSQVLRREGAEALNKLYPTQKRDKRCFTAGEAVSGDGIKFDKLWIDWGDEILNTSTAWVWQDIYSGKLLAHRVAKTENTDLFRLATYDLTAICKPDYVQVDNTRVAANKAMTSGAKNRYRFKNRPEDSEGILYKLGMEVHFTNPDHTMSNPGVKPIERAFGIGGIHDEVATHPQFINRGFSKKTAIPVDEFMEILAQEVQRFNARPKRRTDICNGVMSFDQAFNESYAESPVTLLTEAQRRLLLLMPERVRASKSGMISLKAGASARGKNQYWHEALAEFKKSELVVYYDPQNLSADIAVYTVDGRFIVNAEHRPGVAFNDTTTAREHAKEKQRKLKAIKKVAAAESRMTDLERSNIYPEPEDEIDIPAPGVVKGNFRQKQSVDEDGRLTKDKAVGDDSDLWENFSANVAAMKKREVETSL